jgi:transcriptional regulator with XRE-family HTH domain
MTQEQVAESLGVTQTAVSDWERGRVHPPATRVISLAQLYEVDERDLLSEAGYTYVAERRPRSSGLSRRQSSGRGGPLDVAGLSGKLDRLSAEDRARVEAFVDALLATAHD